MVKATLEDNLNNPILGTGLEGSIELPSWNLDLRTEIRQDLDEYLNNLGIRVDKSKAEDFIDLAEDAITLGQKIPYSRGYSGVDIVRDSKGLIEAMKLRSKVYTEVGFTVELPDPIKGLNYHDFDHNSIILNYTLPNGRIIGTMSMILNSEEFGLQSEEHFSFSQLEGRRNICEMTRLAIEPEFRGVNDRFIFKSLYRETFHIAKLLGADFIIMAQYEGLTKQYEKFGRTVRLNEIDGFGKTAKLDREKVTVLMWDYKSPSEYFVEEFLNSSFWEISN